jgi:hypothetical protein
VTDDNFQNLSLNESFERVAKVAEERAAFNEQLTDHQRGRAGRDYTCTCGYDEVRDNRLEAQAAEIERLREALRFYADAKNWAYVKSAGCNCIDADGGDTARAALEQTK